MKEPDFIAVDKNGQVWLGEYKSGHICPEMAAQQMKLYKEAFPKVPVLKLRPAPHKKEE